MTLSTLALNAGVLISTVSLSGFVALQENRSQVLTALPSPPLPTQVRIKLLAELLSGYQPAIIQLLISGFSYGFPLHYQGDPSFLEAKNLLLALQHPQVVWLPTG